MVALLIDHKEFTKTIEIPAPVPFLRVPKYEPARQYVGPEEWAHDYPARSSFVNFIREGKENIHGIDVIVYREE